MIAVRVQMTRKGDAAKWLDGFEKRLRGPTGVKVGFPAGVSDADLVAYAIYNHEGTAGRTPRRGGWGGPIPSRPFIRVAVFRHRREIRRMLQEQYRAILSGRITSEKALGRIALFGVGIIQKTIAAGLPPANAALTIKLKGAGKNTLNDEGRMRQSVAWAFDDSAGATFKPSKRQSSSSKRTGNAIGREIGRVFRS